MPAGFNGTGIYLRAYDWTTDKTAAIKIQAIRMDEEMDGFSAALSNCICRDGQSTIVANIPMGGNKLTGLGAGSMAGDSVRYEQVALLGGNQTVSGNQTFSGTNSFTGINSFTNATGPQNFTSTMDATTPVVATFQGDRATPADNDLASIGYYLSNDVGTQTNVALFSWQATDVNAATAVDGAMLWGVMTAGTMNYELALTGAALTPFVTGGLTLGDTVRQWLGAYLASDSGLYWKEGTVSLLHTTSPNRLTLSSPTELHIPGTFYATGNAVIGDAAADAVTIKGTVVNSTVSALFDAASAYAFGNEILEGMMVLKAPAAGEWMLFRDSDATWGYHSIVTIVNAGLLGLGAI